MICKECGNLLKEGDKFCPNCGSKVELAVPTPGASTSKLDDLDTSNRTGAFIIISPAHEGFHETISAVVEVAGLAVNGHDKGELVGVVHLRHVANAKGGFSPALVVSVVPVLKNESSVVDRRDDLLGSASGPSSLCSG